ncbi:MAG: sugar transferase [Ignavibacterium sp.]|nr:sugar transferase [Ignavibacterium sp.]
MIDIFISLVCLISLSVFMLLISVAIKLTSRGAIIYKQKRVGYLGYPFTLYKFRSMQENLNENNHSKYIQALHSENNFTDDLNIYRSKVTARCTSIGKFLRKKSFDEIPQFFNILKGDMSLVGPRPHPSYEVIHYKDWYYDRLTVKPGLTGLSKLKFRDSALDYDEAMKLDIWYIKNWSLTLDIKILLKTFFSVIKGKDAE